MSSKIQYEQLKASGLSFGEPRIHREGERKIGDVISILYDGEVPVIITGTKKKGQRSTLFQDNFGKDKLVLNLDVDSSAAKSYNTICEFVEKKIKSGSLDSVVEGIKGMHAKVNRVKPLAVKGDKLFIPVTKDTRFFSIDGKEIETIRPSPSNPVSINGVVGIRISGLYVGPKSVKITLIAEIVMIGPKQVSEKIANLIDFIDDLTI
ncbi:hypothetical protein GGH94_000858 [Coemansia aciculifera]|uniref:Uncharacterized protein n=1 Tax=Coemansia aciculifera TaxID=417176 RepID=A0A9W8IS04_9FUNG|nr:hypothetical protein GGH94_000858 [Coemansia aciculifera]KAJ2876528.1 hypothetical protein GGH93_000689 [Coemansia aciculifera]